MKTDTGKLKVGDRLSRISFLEVIGTGKIDMTIQNEDGMSWRISSGIVAKECYSTQYNDKEHVSKTEIAEILMSARDAIVEVNFHKQANAKTIKDRLTELSGLTEAKAMKELTSILKGDERTMIGHVVGTEPVLGRSVLIDLEKEKIMRIPKAGDEWDSRTRQVDHRTINWLVYKNTKYIVK